MGINIAVTSAGSAPGVAVIKALKRQKKLPIHVTALDMDKASAGNYLADKGLTVPAANSQGFIQEVIKICRKQKIKCLIPIIDEELFVFSKNRDVFEKAGIRLIVNSAETVRLAKDKLLTCRFCSQEGIKAPRVFLKKEVDRVNSSDYPLIIKPIDGRGSKDVVLIKNKKELNFFKDYFKDYIIQQFIKGKEFTIDIVASTEGRILQAIPRHRISTKAGMSYKGEVVRSAELIDYAKGAAQKFKITGPANIQCIVNKRGIYLIEVNPKFAAGLPLTVAAGVNIPVILIKLALGIKLLKRELEFKDGVRMLRFWEEVFVQ